MSNQLKKDFITINDGNQCRITYKVVDSITGFSSDTRSRDFTGPELAALIAAAENATKQAEGIS